jgi:HEAT repeat protein
MLTLLEQPSATARLKAVNLTNELSGPDEVVTNALFTTLNNDDNVNVRLAALEALFIYSNLPEVRKGLVESISHQKSPLVLVTLSKAMVLLQEKGSAEKLKQLLKEHDFDDNVENRIKEDIQKII